MIVVPFRRACLKNDEATGWLAVGLRAGDDGHVGVDHVAVGGGDRAGADALEQRGDAGGVAQPGAVVDVVGVEAGPDQLLEEVGLLVGALRRAEPGDRGRAALGVDLGQPPGDQVERLLPGGLAEVRQHLVVVDQAARLAPRPCRPPALALAVPAAVARAGRVRPPLSCLRSARSSTSSLYPPSPCRRARRRTAGPWGRSPRGGSAARSAAAARRRSPSRNGP